MKRLRPVGKRGRSLEARRYYFIVRDSTNVEFWVEDSGQGIPDDDLSRMFERFCQVVRSRGRNDGGSVLGLSIVRRLIEARGGQIEARTTSGGARFSFILPGK